tara:strand:- start:683 stop:1258 length:576 start_codon:yes stop_codon:yes gene_type:complete
MTLTDLELKLLFKFWKCLAIIVILAVCGTIYHNYVNTYTYNKEYWRFQNNSFKTLIKGSDKDKLYIINYLLENNEYRHDIMISVYMITYLISMVHNNTVYVNVPLCMRFLNYKLNFTELYDYLIYNLIFNSMITFPILIITIQLAHSTIPYISVYTLISLTIFLNVVEKIFKIMFLKENKTSWNIVLKKTE